MRSDFFDVGRFGDLSADFVVEAPVGIFSPGVEAELYCEGPSVLGADRTAGGRSPHMIRFQKDAAGVAQPYAICWPAMEADIVRECIGAVERFAYLSCRSRVVDDQFNAFMPGQIADDLGVNPRYWVELSRPIAVIMGPRQPGRRVRFPLRGHAITECGRNWCGICWSLTFSFCR